DPDRAGEPEAQSRHAEVAREGEVVAAPAQVPHLRRTGGSAARRLAPDPGLVHGDRVAGLAHRAGDVPEERGERGGGGSPEGPAPRCEAGEARPASTNSVEPTSPRSSASQVAKTSGRAGRCPAAAAADQARAASRITLTPETLSAAPGPQLSRCPPTIT